MTASVQLAVLFPLLMLMTLGIISAGVWLHSRNVAQRAATAAVDEARGSYGDVDGASSGRARSRQRVACRMSRSG